MSGFIDARRDGLPEVVQANICIVGAGAAGITLARTLAQTVPGVVLVEAGSFDVEGRTQMLCAGRQLGLRYFDLTSCRLRYFGGTTNHWSGYCRANDPIDYEGRPELGLPAWPFDHDHLAPYIAQAGRSIGIEPRAFSPDEVLAEKGLPVDDLVERHSAILQTKIFQLATDIRLGPNHRDEMATLPNLTVYLNLNVTHIQLDPEGRQVTGLEATTLTGNRCRIQARHVVLCCHAIENARLLLTSNDVMVPGIGNAHDHVGRYFMDHIHVFASRFIPSATFPLVYDRDQVVRRRINANLSFTDETTRAEKLLQYYCRFEPHYVTPATEEALRNVVWNFRQPGNLRYLSDVAQVATELGGATRYELSRRGISYRPPDYFLMDHRLEQAPNPRSRVVISDRRDAIGNLIADLDWQITDHDVESFRRGQMLVGREMAALGYGRIEEEEITRDLVESRIEGHYHHVGTTRMSVTPEAGVVDEHSRVHGVANLHVGGSSVFPTAGYSGPTMMIIAMALRQADYLKSLVD